MQFFARWVLRADVHLPGPLRWLSLAGSLALAAAPAAMALTSFAEGDVGLGLTFLGLAVLLFAIPEFLLRRVPGPVEFLTRRLPYVGPDEEE